MGFELDPKRGVQNSYGVRTTTQKYGGTTSDDVIKTASWTFDYNNVPAYVADNLGLVIPAYSKILSARLEVLTAWVGGTSIALGATQGNGAASPGTVVDAAGFITALQGATANINTRGQLITGTGALVGATATANPIEITGTVVGTYTAGKARLIIQYLREAP